MCSGALISLHKLHNTVLLSINMVLFSYQYLKWVPDITLQKKQHRLTPCDGIVNHIFGGGVKMTPDINPIYVGLERSCPRDSKNVSYVDVGLV